jgi:hypothetical protein
MRGGEIIVEGDVHVDVGSYMSGGNIIIRGDAYLVGDSMEGGSITVEGNCKMAGRYMENGSILLKGDAEDVGGLSKGGRIDLLKAPGTIGFSPRAMICHDGRLLQAEQASGQRSKLEDWREGLEKIEDAVKHPILSLSILALFAVTYIAYLHRISVPAHRKMVAGCQRLVKAQEGREPGQGAETT